MGIRLKDLSKLGYRDNVARSLVVAIVGKHCKHQSKEQIIKTLSDVLENPDTYKENETWGKLAEHLSPTLIEKKFTAYDLLDEPLPYKTYGGKFIETLAKQQMNLAMRLPVSIAGGIGVAYRFAPEFKSWTVKRQKREKMKAGFDFGEKPQK